MKKVLAVLLVGLFVVSLATVLSSAQDYYAGSNYHTYSTGQPGYVTTTDTPVYWDRGVPVFSEPPTGINTGEIEILNRRRSPGTPEGGSS
jgi:hypothetical protein